MDSGATSHLANSPSNLKSTFNIGKLVTIANGNRIPVKTSGSLTFPTQSRPLSLDFILVPPSIIKNLIFVRKFTKDNACSIEFDPLGFSVKNLQTRRTILRSDSTDDIYPVFPTSNKHSSEPSTFLETSSSIWHKRLAHPNNQVLNSLVSSFALEYNKHDLHLLCDACQLRKQIKQSFFNFESTVTAPFNIDHTDLLTSPVQSISGIKYYVLFLDQYSHFLWVLSFEIKIRSIHKIPSLLFLCKNIVQNHH